MSSKVDSKTSTLLSGDVHIDSKAKRMQGFLKRIAKSRGTLPRASSRDHEKEKDTTLVKSQTLQPPSNVPINDTAKTSEEKETNDEAKLKKIEKDIKSALVYYKVILKKGFIQKLPGTATAILESIINVEETIDKCIKSLCRMPSLDTDTSEVPILKEKMHRSITHLVRISDDVLFDSYLHVRVDESSALKAADAVELSLGYLYNNVLPLIKKCTLNAELLKFSSSLSHHSSNNSLDDLDNIPETEILDDCTSTLPGTVSAPPKPPLPNENRSYYGNSKGIRKSISHPGEPNSPMIKEPPAPRPQSHMNSSEYSSLNNGNLGSRSSLSTVSTGSLSSPNPLKHGNSNFFDGDTTIGSQHEIADAGVPRETLRKLQSFSQNYEALAKSTISLFNANDDDDLLSPNNDLEDGAPALPKKKQKHNNENYLQLVGGYYNDRPSSMYDNLNSIGTLPNINNVDEFVRGDGLPKLPPKQRMYEHRGSHDEDIGHLKSSQVVMRKNRNSRRESSAAYEEDNVPALDCQRVSHLLVYKKDSDKQYQVLCGGTIDALIVYATQVDTDDVYYKAFLATYRTFISPAELICKLLYRANRFQTKAKGNSSISMAVLKLLVQVFDEMFEELDKSLFDQLRSQVHRLLNTGELQLGKSLRDKIVSYCIKLQVNHLPTYQPVKSDAEIFEFKSHEISQQMCLLDADYFVKIELPEVLRWGKEQSEALSPNLSRFIGHFNSMSFWVRTLILKETRQQEREKMYKKFLKIMRILKRMNNFSSFLAILSALDSTPIRRLEWPKQYTELLAEDSKLIESSSGFKVYRETLGEAKLPCIPYLGLILTDITFVHLGNPHELPDGKVNFVKRWQQFNILDSVRRFKEQMYEFEKNEKILDFFNEYEDHMDEDDMWEQSLVLKPRGK